MIISRIIQAFEALLALSGAVHPEAKVEDDGNYIAVNVLTLHCSFAIHESRLYIWQDDKLIDAVQFASATPDERRFMHDRIALLKNTPPVNSQQEGKAT